MNDLLQSWFGLNWNDPRVMGVVIVIAILAIVRKWWLVLLLVLLVALAQGLEYLLQHSTLGPDFTKGAVIGVYVFGGILLLFMAIAHYFTKE
ncbi:MAG TPA: hypothetical protein VIX13_05275 [Candidatus Eisenbacteria bacterium]|nr:hypothetical protein [Candidatus Eisenbacteria bacterium]